MRCCMPVLLKLNAMFCFCFFTLRTVSSLIGCKRFDLLIGPVDPTVRGFTLFQGYGGVVGLRSTEVLCMKQSM